MQVVKQANVITGQMMIPDVLRAAPHVRAVFDKYGLRGCGGPNGPAETVEYFARAHGVDVQQLLSELSAAAENPSACTREAPPVRHFLDELADNIYRRFFKAGIVVVLTAGAVWGALLLLRIGFTGSFRAITIHEINAHGHAQIFGWVGLFVMGFAYQAFPRMKHTSLWRPDLANMSFYLMVVGIFARAIGEPLFTTPMFRELAVAAGLAEIAAISIFILVLAQTFRQSGKALEVHDAYIVAAVVFFLVQAIYELALMYAMTAGVAREELIRLIGTYQGPLRDLQIHGFALLMILGVGIRMFPALFGFAAPGARFARISLALLIAAVIGEALFLVVMRETGAVWARWALMGSMLLLAGVSVALTSRWGVFAHATEKERSAKYVRAAVTWLHVSMAMLILMPVYMYVLLPNCQALSESGRHAVEIGFSHAYAGAVRHAITVGFISIMILGMAAKVVPTLNGVDIRQLSSLWAPFALINTGCATRVLFQIGTDFGEWAYPIAGVSGLLEVAAIGLWGIHLWRIMNGWRTAEGGATRPERISPDDKVGLVVEWFPQTLPVFLAKGFAPLANPIMRKTMARAISIRQAAQHHNLDMNELLVDLNRAIFQAAQSGPDEGRIPLPVINV